MAKKESPFSSHPIGEEKTKNKRVVRKKILAQKAEQENEGTVEREKMARIDKELKSIYSDNSGRIPNMKEISKKKRHPVLRGFFALIIIGGLMAAVAWAGFFYLPSKTQIGDNNLGLEINGPTEFSLGATTTYIIRWKNKQNTALNKPVLTINYPEGFVFLESSIASGNTGNTQWNLDAIKAGESGELKITGKNYGPINQEKSWRLFFNYQPENFASELQKSVTLNTKIIDSPFSVSIFGPEKTITQDSVNYTIKFENSADWQPNKLIIKAILPDNFLITSSSPKINSDKTWVIENSDMATSAPLTYKITGAFSDKSDEFGDEFTAEIKTELILPFGADQKLFVIAEKSINTEVSKNSQNLYLAINGSMGNLMSRPGETLNFSLNFKNMSKESVKNASIKLTIDAPSLNRQSAMNWAKIDDKFDGTIVGEQLTDKIRRGVITWTSKQIKDLSDFKSGKEINIDIRLPIKDTANFDLASIGEHTILVSAEAVYKDESGENKVIASNPIIITINSDLELEVRAKTISETEREITWILTNSFHALKNIELSASLFGDTQFTSESAPAGTMEFDEKNKIITWKIPDMPEGVDVLAMPFKININQINSTQNTLISKIKVKALDAITGQTIEFMGDEVPM
jgi:hypothetical protein